MNRSSTSRIATLLVTTTLFALISCATVEVQEEATLQNVPFPQLEQRTLRPERDALLTVEDYKLRERRSDRIRILYQLHSFEELPLTAELRDMSSRLLRAALGDFDRSTPGVELSELPLSEGQLELPLRDALYERASHSGIDGVLLIEPKFTLGPGEKIERFTLRWRLFDPVTGELLAEREQTMRVDHSKSVERQLDLVRSGNQLRVVESRGGSIVTASVQSAAELLAFFEHSVTGLVTLQSSSPDTEVLLHPVGVRGSQRRSLGRTPIHSLRLDEGSYELEFRRRGHESQRSPLQVRSGDHRNDFITWSDDTSHGSLALYTAPAGMRLALNGMVHGQTPLWISAMIADQYDIELSQARQGSERYRVVVESSLAIGEQGRELLFLQQHLERFEPGFHESGFWQAVSEEGQLTPVSMEGGGLSVLQSGVARSRWSGLRTRPLLESEVGGELRFDSVVDGEEPSIGFGLFSASQSLFIFREDGHYHLVRYEHGQQQQLEQYRPLRERLEGSIGVSYRPDRHQLQIRLDGGRVATVPFRPADDLHFVVLTRGESVRRGFKFVNEIEFSARGR